MGTHYRGARAEIRALDAYIKLVRATASVQTLLERGLRESGLTPSQLGVLEMLLHLGPQHPHRIGRKLLLSRANVTLLVDRLEERRMVRRAADPKDRRRITIHLTRSGRARIKRVFPGHLARIVLAFSGLDSQEQQDLARLCRKLGLHAQASVNPNP